MLTLLEDQEILSPAGKSYRHDSYGTWSCVQFTKPGVNAQDRFEEAEQVLKEVKTLYIKHGITNGLWKTYLNLGKVYLSTDKNAMAEEMLKKSQRAD